MSAIFGIIDLGTKPLNKAWMTSMQRDLSHRATKAIHTSEGDHWALGHALMALTPEAQYDRQPLKIGDHWIVADARLDEREAAMDRLDIPEKDRPRTTDAQLLLKSYLAFGPDFVKDIYGDFAFFIWNEKEKTGMMARDQIGVKTLVYSLQDGLLAFSTEVKALVKLPFVPDTINMEYIRLGSAGASTGHEATAWAAVHRIPPATYFSLSNGKLERVQYWKAVRRAARRTQTAENKQGAWGPAIARAGKEQGVKDPTSNFQLPSYNIESAAKQLKELMVQAVRDRLRGTGPVGIPLSGGLDSSSIAALAIPILREQGRKAVLVSAVLGAGSPADARADGRQEAGGQSVEHEVQGNPDTRPSPLTPHHSPEEVGEERREKIDHPASSVPRPALKDEKEYIRAFREMYPDAEYVTITDEELSFTATLEENLERHYHPENYFYYLDDAINERLQQRGVRRVLSGYVGDTTVSNWAIDPVPYLIRAGKWVTAFQVLKNRRLAEIRRKMEDGRWRDSGSQGEANPTSNFRIPTLDKAKSKKDPTSTFHVPALVRAKRDEYGAGSLEQGAANPTSTFHVPSLVRAKRDEYGAGSLEQGAANPTSNFRIPTLDKTKSISLKLKAGKQLLKELVKAWAPAGWLMRYQRWRKKQRRWGFEELPVRWTEAERAQLKRQSEDFYRKFTLDRASLEDQIWDMAAVHFKESWDTGPSHYGIEFTYPWADRRIIEFLLSLPVEYFEMDGRKRGLIRRAMECLLPPLIIDRKDKKDYSPGYPLIMRREIYQILSKYRSWQQMALLAPWVEYFQVQAVIDHWMYKEKRLTFDYKLFFVKNLFVFLSFLDQHLDKAHSK